MIRSTCPTCRSTRDHADHLAGWEVQCFWCRQPISVGAVTPPAPRASRPTPAPAGRTAGRAMLAGFLAVPATIVLALEALAYAVG